MSQLFLSLFINLADQTLERRIHRTMIREFEWSTIVVDLTDVVAFTENAIAPRRYASFLRRIVNICANVVLIRRKDGDAGL